MKNRFPKRCDKSRRLLCDVTAQDLHRDACRSQPLQPRPIHSGIGIHRTYHHPGNFFFDE